MRGINRFLGRPAPISTGKTPMGIGSIAALERPYIGKLLHQRRQSTQGTFSEVFRCFKYHGARSPRKLLGNIGSFLKIETRYGQKHIIKESPKRRILTNCSENGN